MKKIILGMLIILTSLSFSNNLDKYESKRVFDKNIEVLLTGNYDKYKDDPEMVRALGEIDKKYHNRLLTRACFFVYSFLGLDITNFREG